MSANTKKQPWLLFIFVFLVALFVRFIWLDRSPSALYYDEIDLGYQIKSFLSTGKDYRGGQSPFFFRSFNTDKTPFPILFSTLPSLLFSSPEYQVRAGAALAGSLVVALAMLLVYQLSKNKLFSIVTGLVFAFSPWQIQFSRLAFEAIFMLLVFMSSLVSFFYWTGSKKQWAFYLSAVLLGLNIYTYRPMSFFCPLTILLLLIIFRRDFIKQGIRKSLLWLILIAILTLPFLYSTTIGSADQPRINQISIFSNSLTPIQVIRNREVDSHDFTNPEIGKKPVLTSIFFHNKGVSIIKSFVNNYYQSFSSEFLFLSGDPNCRHGVPNTGVLYYIDIVGLVIGLVYLFNNRHDKKHQLLFLLLLLSPIPSALTMDGSNHASRLLILSGPLLIIIGLGYGSLIKILKKKHQLLALFLLVSIWSVSVVFYLHQYFVHYPIECARQFGYGYKQAFTKTNNLSEYKNVQLTTAFDSPILYFLYWSNITPREVQQYGTNFGGSVNKNQPLDRVKTYENGKICDPDSISRLKTDTVYLVTNMDLPFDLRDPQKLFLLQGVKLLDIIKYPDNEVAFYLITRDSKNGTPVTPLPKSVCP